MRNSILASLVALLAFAPPSLGAPKKGKPSAARPAKPAPKPQTGDEEAQPQDEGEGGEGGEGTEGEGGMETEGTEVSDQQPATRGTKVTTGGKETAPGEVHTVVKGDTLWDLSQHYLGNPWYWPKVWSYNPEIANPHWIYPGNTVRFFPAGEEEPSRVEVGNAPPAATGPVQEIHENVEAGEMIPMGEEAGNVEVFGKIGAAPSKPGLKVIHDTFVTPKEVEAAGTITASFSDSFTLSFPETVYVKFKQRADIHVGDRYVIYRTGKAVVHPLTGKMYGYITRLLGTVKVISVGEQLVTAQIVDDWEGIYRGDKIGPFGERLGEVLTPRPNEREINNAYIIASTTPTEEFGQFQTVIMDKGSADGVQPGNTFTIVRSQDMGGDKNYTLPPDQRGKLPLEDIGSCIAVDVRERASTCLITRSLLEFEIGERAQMRMPKAEAPVSSR